MESYEHEIKNRVEESGLVQIDLSLLSNVSCVELDFTPWLWQEMIVKEKEFRKSVGELDKDKYAGQGVGIVCSSNAIIPDWAWMLIASKLSTAEFVIVGDLEDASNEALRRSIDKIDIEKYKDQRIVVKGCSGVGGPNALVQLLKKLQPIAKSIMFGEACSTVPLFKRPTT